MRFGWLLSLIVLTGATTQAQTVIRAEGRLVVVDAVVTDKKGKPIRELTAADFHLWDDAKEQRIVSASLESAARTPDQTHRSYLLLFFDGSTISPSRMATLRSDVTRFVDATISPDRYLAVAHFTNALRIPQNFTAMAEPLKRAISGVPAIGAGEPVLQGLVRPNAAYGAPGTESAYTQSVLFPGLRTLAEAMSSIRGRKALILFSGAVPRTATIASEIAETVLACNRSGVAVYVMDSAGALRGLADQTGGRMFTSAGNLNHELGKILDQQEEYYSLSFVPPETSDSNCHALRVKVDRAGVEVQARNGYCRVKPRDVLAGKAAGKTVEEQAARATAGSIPASLQLPYFYRGPNLARVVAAMEVLPSAIRFQKVKGKSHAELNLVGVAHREDGTPSARFSDTVSLDFDSDKEAAAFAAKPYHYENQFDLGAGRYRFRMAFTSGEQSGKVEMPLVIAPWDFKSLAISGLAMVAETRQVPDLATALEDAALEDHRPLRAGSLEITPSGSQHCSRNSRCQAFVEIYEPLLAGPNAPSVALQVRIFDRKTGELKVNAAPFGVAPYVRQGKPVVPVPLTLPVSDLAPGSYRLELTALHSSGPETAVCQADLVVD